MKIAVRNLENEAVKEIELPEEIFAYPYKEHLIHLAVVANRAANRAGTHKAKDRGEVRGSGRKPYRQKGTGRARAGSSRSPLRRAGGVVHGPTPRDYHKQLTAREKRNALKSALSRKLAEERVVVLDSLDLSTPKTKELARQLTDLGTSGRVLLVDQYENRNLALAARNNPQTLAVDALGITVYDVVDRSYVLLSEEALGRLSAALLKK